MTGEAPVARLLEHYRIYRELMEAVGHTVEPLALAGHLAQTAEQRNRIRRLLDEVVEGNEGSEQLPASVDRRMQKLATALVEEVVRGSEELASAEPDPLAIREALREVSERDRERIADVLVQNGHRAFLRRRHISVAEFRKLVAEREAEEEMALVKLVPYLQRQLKERGLHVPQSEVRSWFDSAPDDAQVPYCAKFVLSQADGEFVKGLIPLEEMVGEEDPDAWLERVRRKLRFRSHSAMHKAIAEATSQKYDCIHKALSGRSKAKRIQAEIKYCLNHWLREVEEGRDIRVSDDHRGVPVEKMSELLPALERKFDTKEQMYRLISSKTGIKTGSVRRYFQSGGQLKYAPMSVYRWAKRLAAEEDSSHKPDSYLCDARTRQVATELARKANEKLRRWRTEGDVELQVAYKELRRALIMAMKEGRRKAPAAV